MSHWYDSEGNPRHFEGKDGKATTLREARKLNLYPSVTTIGNIKAKFALTNWLQEEVAMTAAELLLDCLSVDGDLRIYLDTETDREWAKSVVKASREKTMAKADEGADIHDILEKFQIDPYSQAAIENEGMCHAVAECIMENTGLGLHGDFYSETRFCKKSEGYAGMCDLHSKHINGEYLLGDQKDEWVIDYKSKDTVDAKTRGFPEQAEQLAAYAHGLGRPRARIANIFISREDPTQVKFFEHKDPLAWERFRHGLMLWQVTNKFGPYYDNLIDLEKAA